MIVNKIKRNVNLRFLIIPISIILVICFSLMANDNGTSSLKEPNIPASIMSSKKSAVGRQILGAATQVFEPSLEMKENVEFLLTPALLVQEAISENIVITYPTE